MGTKRKTGKSKVTRASQVYRGVAEEFACVLQRELGECLTSVVLFGSAARGTACKKSDIDVLIVVNGAPDAAQQTDDLLTGLCIDFEDAHLWPLKEKGYRANLQYFVFSEAEALNTRPFYFDMVSEAKLLFDRAGFFRKKLTQVRQQMKALGTRKIYLNKHVWMWQLKANPVPGEAIEL